MRVAYAVSALVLAGAPFGCSALLGDFTEGSSPAGEDGGRGDTGAPVPEGGGADSTISDAGPDVSAPSDAPIDVIEEPEAAPPLQLLSCASLLSPTPKMLLSIPPFDAGSSGNDNFPLQNMYVEHLPGLNSARVAISTNSATGGATQIFTVSETGGSTQSISILGTSIQAEHKTSNAMALFLDRYSTSDFALYAIDDTDPGNNPNEVPVATIADPPNEANGDFRASVVDIAPGTYFTLASYQTATNYDLASWTSPPTTSPWRVLPSTGQGLAVDGPLVTDGTNAYEFTGPPGPGGSGGPSTLYQYTFPIADGGGPTSRQITPDAGSAATMAAAHTASGYAIVFVELGGAQSGNYRAGVVDPTKLDSFMVDDLASLSFKTPAGDASFFDTTPFGNNGGGSRWLSNGDFGSMGTGGTGGGDYTGLNFYVGTPTGQWIIETAGTGQNLLSGTTVVSASFDLSSAVNDLVFSFDVAWTEQLADGTAVLYFNVLSCQL